MFQGQNFNNNMNYNNNMNFNNSMNFNNQMSFQAFLNMLMQMNPNFNFNFPMNFNPNFGGNMQQQQPQFNLSNSAQNIILNGGVMPRPNNTPNMMNNVDLFPNYPPTPRLNVFFETGAGLKVNIPTPPNAPIHELLTKFMNKVGVSESLMGEKIFFIVNGKTISINEQTQCEKYFRDNALAINSLVKIVVIDASNVIGA